MSKRRNNLNQYLTALLINLSAAALFALSLFAARALRLPWWSAIILVVAALSLVLSLGRRRIVIRAHKLRIFKEVSASRCADRFIRLAALQIDHQIPLEHFLGSLREVVHIRKHPNLRFLQPIEALVQVKTLGPNELRSQIRAFLKVLPATKALIREEVVQSVATFLRSLSVTSILNHTDTYLVLYGYSRTVCDALVEFGEPPFPIFLVQDIQYGAKASLAEDIQVANHLSRRSIVPISVRFEEIEKLTSPEANFLHSTSGELIPISRKRRLLALIGCEACDVEGKVFIPAHRRGQPSETAKFLEMFKQSAYDDLQSPVENQIVVVTESYKVYPKPTPDFALTHAPLKTSVGAELLYLLGLEGAIRFKEVTLVGLGPSEISAIVDDLGVHTLRDGSMNLKESMERWEARTAQKTLVSLFQVGIQSILDSVSLVICDLNGVLADDEATHFAAFVSVVQRHGSSLSFREYLEDCSGLSDEEGVKNLLALKKLSGSVPDILSAKREEYSKLVASGIPAFPKITELVRHFVDEGKSCHLVTSSPSDEPLFDFIRKHDLDALFAPQNRHFGVRQEIRRKTYTSILGRSGGPSKCLLLDDSPGNLKLASSLGMRTIGFATNRPQSELQADVIVSGAEDLLERLTTRSNV